MSSITTSAIDTPYRRSVERTCDDLALFALAVVGVVAALTFRDYGLGWDDYTHAEYADLLLRMYGSGFKDTGALSFANLYMYGGGFDLLSACLAKLFLPDLKCTGWPRLRFPSACSWHWSGHSTDLTP